MGCHCDATKDDKLSEFNIDEVQKDLSITILKSKRNSTKSDTREIEKMQNKFIEEINEIEDYTILKSIDIKEYLTYECLQAYEIFSNESYKFTEIYEKQIENLKNKINKEKSENIKIDYSNIELYSKKESCEGENESEESESRSKNDFKSNNKRESESKKESESEDKKESKKGSKNKDNTNLLDNYKIFKMPPIKYIKNDSIYEGEFYFDEKKCQFSYAGNGVILTSKKEFIQIKNQPKDCKYIENGRIFYPNGDIFMGTITKEEPYSKIKGILFQNNNGNYDNFIVSNNFDEDNPYIIKYFNNGDIYEGETVIKENRCIFSGKGQLTKKENNSIFNGNFSGNLYNGKGKLFMPLGGLSQQNNIEQNLGKTIISSWINGKPYGDGIIQEKYDINENVKNTTCSFRFGKIIKYTSCLVKKKVKLHENIFEFFYIWEISPFVNILKIKSLYNYLKKNNNLNSTKIKVYRALRKYDIGNYRKEVFNNELFELKIFNYKDIINNILKNISNFLPFVCYRSEGGEIEQRYRPFNIFNPDQKKLYSTNYLTHRNSNITINAIFNLNIYEEYKNNEEEIYDLQEEYIYNLMNWATLYKTLFDKFEANYPVRNISTDIIDYNEYILSVDKIGDIDNILCTIQYITIYIPDKIDDFTVLINPCYFLAIYLGKYENNQSYNNEIEIENEDEINTNSNNNIDINGININDKEIKASNYNMKFIKKKYDQFVINEEENKYYEYIEFDTNKQKNIQYNILCLVKIKEKNESNKPYVINLKKFYHIGNSINIKLLNQINALNKKEDGFSIDFGTIHFYGDVIYLRQ